MKPTGRQQQQQQQKNGKQPNIVMDDSEVVNISTSTVKGNVIDTTMQMVRAQPENNVTVNNVYVNNSNNNTRNTRGNRGKNSGEGEIMTLLQAKTKEELIEHIGNMQQILDLLKEKVVKEYWTMGELGLYNKVMIANFDPYDNNYRKFYNNKLNPLKKGPVEIESDIITSIPPALTYYTVSSCISTGAKWSVLNHSAGTFNILKAMYPYHDFSIVKIFQNNAGSLRGLQMCMTSKLFPKKCTFYYGVPGKVKVQGAFEQSEDKIIQTYAEKFANCFNFLKTIKIDETMAADTRAFLNVINTYKTEFTLVDPEYRFIMDLIIDQIAHFYLNDGLIPSSKEFTIDILNKYFPPEVLYRSDLFLSDREVAVAIPVSPYIARRYKYPRDYFNASKLMYAMVRDAVFQGKLPIGKKLYKNNVLIKDDDKKKIFFPKSMADKSISFDINVERQKLLDVTAKKKQISDVPNVEAEDKMVDARELSIKVSGLDPLEAIDDKEFQELLKNIESEEGFKNQDENTSLDVNKVDDGNQDEITKDGRNGNQNDVLDDLDSVDFNDL